ncbi:hypothetical protein GCM10008940_11740 [Microbulbifer agarilyticus]
MSVQPHTINLPFHGFNVPLTLCSPPNQSHGRPLVLVAPALGVPAIKYQQLLTTLGERGYQTAIYEMPGTGKSTPHPRRGNDYGYSDLVFELIPEVLQALKSTLGHGPALMLGHSIGGQTMTLAARAGLTGDARVVSVAAGHLDCRSWRGPTRLAIMGAALAAHTSTRLLGYFPGRQMRFGGREAATLMRDWGNGILRGRFAPEARIPKQAALGHRPLHLCIKGDPFAPVGATRRLAALVQGEVREVAPTFPHGNPHLSWIKNPAPMVEIIEQWIEGVGAPDVIQA